MKLTQLRTMVVDLAKLGLLLGMQSLAWFQQRPTAAFHVLLSDFVEVTLHVTPRLVQAFIQVLGNMKAVDDHGCMGQKPFHGPGIRLPHIYRDNQDATTFFFAQLVQPLFQCCLFAVGEYIQNNMY